METVLIDEREIIEKFVERAQKVNQILIACQSRKMTEFGLNHNHYFGGLECTISSKEMSLERNVNNLLAVYSSNYAESISFQCENIKHMNTLNLVQDFLKMKGLEEDFIKFRDADSIKRKSEVTMKIMPNEVRQISPNINLANTESHVSK